MIYVFDSTSVSLLMRKDRPIDEACNQADAAGHVLGMTSPVYYEIQRGLLWRNMTARMKQFHFEILPKFAWIPLLHQDWEQAAQFWSDARQRGYQLSDVDLLLAAVAYRLNTVLVSDDDDFDALPIQRENWHRP